MISFAFPSHVYFCIRRISKGAGGGGGEGENCVWTRAILILVPVRCYIWKVPQELLGSYLQRRAGRLLLVSFCVQKSRSREECWSCRRSLYRLAKKLRPELKLSSFYQEGSLFHSAALLLIIMMTRLSLTSTPFSKTLLPLTSSPALVPVPFCDPIFPRWPHPQLICDK